MMKSLLLTLAMILCICTSAVAKIDGTISGLTVPFNGLEDYLSISIDGLKEPVLKNPSLFRRIFGSGARTVLFSINVDVEGENIYTGFPFSLKRRSNADDYELEKLFGSEDIVDYFKVPHNKKIKVTFSYHVFDDDSESIADKVISSIKEFGGYSDQRMRYLNSVLKFIKIFIPDVNRKDTIYTFIDPDDLKSEINIMHIDEKGTRNELTQLIIKAVHKTHFTACNSENASQLDFLADLEPWKTLIVTAADGYALAADDKVKDAYDNLLNAFIDFKQYLERKPLTEKDRSLFAVACLKSWISPRLNDAYDNTKMYGILLAKSGLAKLKYLRGNNDCRVSGPWCGGDPCIAFSRFMSSINASDYTAAKLYAANKIQVVLDGVRIASLKADADFGDLFIGNAYSEQTFEGDGAIYELNGSPNVQFSYKDKDYNYSTHKVKIRQVSNVDGNYVVTSIMLTSRSAGSKDD